MTAAELAVAKQVLADAAFKAAVAEIVGAAMKGAIAAAVIELIFSILENSLLCVEGKITQSELVNKSPPPPPKLALLAVLLLAFC